MNVLVLSPYGDRLLSALGKDAVKISNAEPIEWTWPNWIVMYEYEHSLLPATIEKYNGKITVVLSVEEFIRDWEAIKHRKWIIEHGQGEGVLGATGSPGAASADSHIPGCTLQKHGDNEDKIPSS